MTFQMPRHDPNQFFTNWALLSLIMISFHVLIEPPRCDRAEIALLAFVIFLLDVNDAHMAGQVAFVVISLRTKIALKHSSSQMLHPMSEH